MGLETYPLRVVLRVDGEDKPTELPVLLPHEVYHAMHEKSVQLFLQSVVGDEGLGALLSFWEQALTERWAAKHPAFADPSRLDRMVPVRFWIDGVEVYSDAETTYVAFASATGHGAHPSLHHLWMASLMDRLVPTRRLKRAAWREIVRAFGWSLQCGLRGAGEREREAEREEGEREGEREGEGEGEGAGGERGGAGATRERESAGWMPRRGFYGEWLRGDTARARAAGQRVAGEFSFAFAGNLGDRKAYQELHGWRRYWKCTHMCHLCGAQRPTARADQSLNYTFFGNDAACWRTIFSHEEAVAAMDSPFEGAVEGYHVDLDLEDLLHNILKGHGRQLVASYFGEVLLEGLLGDDFEDAMVVADCELRVWSRGLGVRPPRHRLNLRSIGWQLYDRRNPRELDQAAIRRTAPEMSSWWKAWEMQVLIPFAAQHALDHGCEDAHGKLRAACLWGLAEWLHVVGTSGRVLDDESRGRSKIAASTYLLAYQKLSAEARAAGSLMWHPIPKHHYFAHMARRTWSTGWNPTHESTFMMEDLGGRTP